MNRTGLGAEEIHPIYNRRSWSPFIFSRINDQKRNRSAKTTDLKLRGNTSDFSKLIQSIVLRLSTPGKIDTSQFRLHKNPKWERICDGNDEEESTIGEIEGSTDCLPLRNNPTRIPFEEIRRANALGSSTATRTDEICVAVNPRHSVCV